jgi:exosortase
MLLLALLLWAYWDVVRPLWSDWQQNANYSVGQLVPLAALWLLWRDRRHLRQCRLQPCWWGLGLLLTAQLVRLWGLQDLRESLERYALVMTIWGLVLLVAGSQVFRRTGWILLFLLLMVPLPQMLDSHVSSPLQSLSTRGAVVMLELAGVGVNSSGNVIVLNERTSIEVAEACSGLRMLTAFIVVTAVLACLVDRPRWQKGILLISSVPVAIVCNVARLFATALLYMWTSKDLAEKFFHDFAGFAMMPIAIALLIGELRLLKCLVTHEPAPAADSPPS